MAPTPAHRSSARTPLKEAVYVRIALPDGSSAFYPATDYVGKKMPFEKPREICAMRVHPNLVAFSLRHLTKTAIKEAREENLRMPSNALTRLTKKAESLDGYEPGILLIEHRDEMIRMRIVVDQNKVASVEPEGDEVAFELDPRGERISIYFKSPVRDRILALGFQGHLGKPGAIETVSRCAAKALNAALALPEFQLLADLATVSVPSRPGVTYVAARTEAVHVNLPVRLFDEELQPVAAGAIIVEVDLQHANVNADRLLFSLSPQNGIAEHFGPYQDNATRFVAEKIQELLGDDVRGIALDITLGEVDQGTVDRVTETLRTGLIGVDLTPTKRRAHDPAGV